MMDKHTEIIFWIVKDNIFLGHLTHLTNFHQYTIFATSRKKGRYVSKSLRSLLRHRLSWKFIIALGWNCEGHLREGCIFETSISQ